VPVLRDGTKCNSKKLKGILPDKESSLKCRAERLPRLGPRYYCRIPSETELSPVQMFKSTSQIIFLNMVYTDKGLAHSRFTAPEIQKRDNT